MSAATDTTVTVTFDPNAINLQSDIIYPASANKAGLLTAAQAALLQSLVAAGLSPALVTAITQVINLTNASAGPKIFSNALRPPANDPQFADAFADGRVGVIWNSTDKRPNYTDGVNWYNAEGGITS